MPQFYDNFAPWRWSGFSLHFLLRLFFYFLPTRLLVEEVIDTPAAFPQRFGFSPGSPGRPHPLFLSHPNCGICDVWSDDRGSVTETPSTPPPSYILQPRLFQLRRVPFSIWTPSRRLTERFFYAHFFLRWSSCLRLSFWVFLGRLLLFFSRARRSFGGGHERKASVPFWLHPVFSFFHRSDGDLSFAHFLS